MISTKGAAPTIIGRPTPRFTAIPNILQGKALCVVIKKWQEAQQAEATSGGINWEIISRDLNSSMGEGETHLTPSACQVLWKYLAYGQMVTEADLVASSGDGAGSRQDTNPNVTAFPAPAGASLPARPYPCPAPLPKKAPPEKDRNASLAGGETKSMKKRPGTIYVPCEYCLKEISHSNISAHVRKAHPDLAKTKKERVRKPPVSATAEGAVSSSSKSFSSNLSTEQNNTSISGGSSSTGTGTGTRASSRSTCPHCKGDFSRSHLSKHIKKRHPVEGVLEALLRRVVFEAEFLQPFEPSTLKRPAAVTSSAQSGHLSAAVTFPHAPAHAGMTPSPATTAYHFAKKMKMSEDITTADYEEEARGDSGEDNSDFMHCNLADSELGDDDPDRSESEEQRRARKRRESVTQACKYCNVIITKKHMIVHIRKLHPEKLAVLVDGEDRNGEQLGLVGLCSKEQRSEKFPSVACKYCGKEITKKSIRAHVRNLHPEALLEPEGGRDADTPTRPAVSCPTTQCKYCMKIITKKSIRAHVRNLHPEAAVEEVLSAAASAASAATAISTSTSISLAAGKACDKIRNAINSYNSSNFIGSFGSYLGDYSGVGGNGIGGGIDFGMGSGFGSGSGIGGDFRSGSSSTGGESKAASDKSPIDRCEFCNLLVPQSEMKNHVRTSHERTITTPCKYCPKQIQNRNMNTHVRKYHVVESVVEVLVTKVASLSETQPAVLDCRLPVSRLQSISALGSVSSSSGSGSARARPFSTQRELDEGDAQQRRELEEAAAAAAAQGREIMERITGNNKQRKRKMLASSSRSSSSSMSALSELDGTAVKKTRQLAAEDAAGRNNMFAAPVVADFSNLDLLATFASSLLPSL